MPPKRMRKILGTFPLTPPPPTPPNAAGSDQAESVECSHTEEPNTGTTKAKIIEREIVESSGLTLDVG